MPVPPRDHPVGSQGCLRTGGIPLSWPLNEKAKAQECESIVQSQTAGGLWSPRLAHSSGEKGEREEQDWKPIEG